MCSKLFTISTNILYFTIIDFNNHNSARKFTGMSNESINSPFTPNNILSPLFSYAGTNTIIKVNGSLIQDKITYTDGKIVNIYTVFEIVFRKLYKFWSRYEFFC